ncbi:hypothetical protein HNY73_007789 [Argiope bruennichi]|uniref:Uncharacterized protein n=1 Tax=Argiope bruennichi TaxID=94029 RepID=A0A8T0FHN1_ARGBR|nr:hypothetical protein HNY73_007789 [Argiope bruennichi]
MNQQDWIGSFLCSCLPIEVPVNETTGFTPSQMLFGRELRLPCDLLFGRPPDVPSSPEEYVHELQERLESVHEFARLNGSTIATEKDEDQVRHEELQDMNFTKGDKVWFWKPIRRKGLSPKLQQIGTVHITVLKRLNDVCDSYPKSKNSRLG